MSRRSKERLLVALPALPVSGAGRGQGAVHRLLKALSRRWELELAWAAPSDADGRYVASITRARRPCAPEPSALRDRCRRALDTGGFRAFVIVDHPYTRECLETLSNQAVPAVLVLLEGQSPWKRGPASSPEDVLSGRYSDRERRSRQACRAREIWSLGPGDARGLDSSRAVPRAFARSEAFDGEWMDRRLRRLLGEAKAFGRRAGLTSIVVPCFNNLRLTRECLDAVARHTPEPHEVIVVDDGSTDGTAEFVRRKTSARLVRRPENGGFIRAVNAGTEAARGRYIVWLNNDAVVTPGWLSSLVAHAESAPWIGAVGPCTNETVGIQKVRDVAYRSLAELPAFAAAWSLKHQGRAVGVHRLTGFCLLLKREAVRQVGLLDERFGRGYYEEFDYCLRLRQAGYDLVCALDSFVHHHGHKTFGAEKASRVAANRDILIDKWCRRAFEFMDDLDPEGARRPLR
jgi:GT2 family glycosyltransferase